MGRRGMMMRVAAFLAVFLGALVFNALFSGSVGFFFGAGLSPDAHITPDHFVQPRFPGGFMADFGMGAVFAAALLAAFYLATTFLAVAHMPDAGGAENAPLSPAKLRIPETYRTAVFGGIILFFVVFFVVRTALFEPVGGRSRLAAAMDFMVGFNRSVLLKSKFDEKGYEAQMLESLMLSRIDFMRFARSGYWAYYSDEKTTRWTDRKRVAAEKLSRLFEAGVLSNQDVFEGFYLMRETGDLKRAEEMIGYLKRKDPGNSEFLELFEEISAQNRLK